eukprot:PDM71915.1 hypothetical protein PRIPAC_38322 [Pristionchus pacificus]
MGLVDLLHSRGILGGSLDLGGVRGNSGAGGEVLLLILLVDVKTELDHAEDARGVLGGVLEGESGGEKGSLEEKVDKILHGLVVLVGLDTLGKGPAIMSHLKSSLADALNEGRGGDLLARGGGRVAKEVSELLAVGRVLVDAELEVLSEVLVELLEVVLVLGDLLEELDALLDEILADHLEDLRLLEHLTRDVQREVLRVDNSSDEVKVFGHQLVAVLHDEHTAHYLDRVLGLLVLEEIEGSALGHVEESTELELSLDGEVLDGEMVLPVCKRLVEFGVLLVGDVIGVASPDGLLLVELLILGVLLLDLLSLLLVLLVGILVLSDILDLSLLLLLLLLIGLVILNLLLTLLLDDELDGVSDELRVLLDDLLDLALLEVLDLVLLDVHGDLGTTGDLRTPMIYSNRLNGFGKVLIATVTMVTLILPP